MDKGPGVEWVRLEYLIPGILMLGYLLINGARGLTAFKSLRDIFQQKDDIKAIQKRHDKEIQALMKKNAELEKHMHDCDEKNAELQVVASDMKVVLRTIAELLHDAEKHEEHQISAYVLQAMVNVLKPYLNK